MCPRVLVLGCLAVAGVVHRSRHQVLSVHGIQAKGEDQNVQALLLPLARPLGLSVQLDRMALKV